MQAKNSIFKPNSKFLTELNKLDLDLRNRVRAIVSNNDNDSSTELLNKIRKRMPAIKVFKVENALRAYQLHSTKNRMSLLPLFFSPEPQTHNRYARLSKLTFENQLEYLEIAITNNSTIVERYFNLIILLNDYIFSSDFASADKVFDEISNQYGYSHFLLRKALFIKEVNVENIQLNSINKFLTDCGIKSNNTMVSVIIQCYQNGQDYLSLKRSVMNYPDRQEANKYLRDMLRIPFHPYVKDKEDLNDLILSSLQSSLIDAILIAFVNQKHISQRFKNLKEIFEKLNSKFKIINSITKLYLDKKWDEYSLFKQSSVWMEFSSINEYRLLHDYFFDDPNAKYLNFDDSVSTQLSSWVSEISLDELVNCKKLTNHNNRELRILENSGNITRSSVFNFLLFKNQGIDRISEENLYKLMGVTIDLSRTIKLEHIRALEKITTSVESKIILLLLIIKKSKNEKEEHSLRKYIQDIVIEKYDGSLIGFFDYIAEKSKEVSQYAYEVLTEDFIAKLYYIAESTLDITEIRASLHRWMGKLTGEKAYFDRARTLLIDHQINKIRNELDDHRIYVDSARFIDWINDEILRDITSILSGVSTSYQDDEFASENEMSSDISLLYSVLDRAYFTFCNNNFFGIASYLGRRIRHGTFNGHMHAVITSLESKYPNFLKNSQTQLKWNNWKDNYENHIKLIISDYLHVETAQKKNGLLKPDVNNINKTEIALDFAREAIKNYIASNNVSAIVQILVEYCWRLLEVDLRNINSFLKHQKTTLVCETVLGEIKSVNSYNDLSKDFCREVQNLVSDKLNTIATWFKRPISVSPKASLSLLFEAVVVEVRQTYPNFSTEIQDNEIDLELMGGAYQLLYDAFYVLVFNAAKHGKANGKNLRKFSLIRVSENPTSYAVIVTITSDIRDEDSEYDVNKRIALNPNDNIENAQIEENRSGIRKLHQLKKSDPNFGIDEIICKDRKVIISISYILTVSTI